MGPTTPMAFPVGSTTLMPLPTGPTTHRAFPVGPTTPMDLPTAGSTLMPLPTGPTSPMHLPIGTSSTPIPLPLIYGKVLQRTDFNKTYVDVFIPSHVNVKGCNWDVPGN